VAWATRGRRRGCDPVPRSCHPHPEELALRACSAERDCQCLVWSDSVGRRLNRDTCEDRYRAAVREIVEALLPGCWRE